MATQQVAPVTCPSCNFRFSAPVESIINGQDPAQKAALLQGRVNLVQCPQCGVTTMLQTPVLYYDLEKELALVFAPNNLQLAGSDQEKVIGQLTNTLVNSLPTEQKKFYLFNPKQFLTLENMVKAILEGDGITEEMLESQKAKVKLIEEFLQISDKDKIKEEVKAHDEQLDKEFFEVLTVSIQSAQMAGDQEGVQALLGLRNLLARMSTKGKQAVAEIDAEMEAVFIQSQDELVEKLRTAENDEAFEQLIAAGHPMLDYTFFQKLTGQIDAAGKAKDKQKVAELTALRSKILDVKAEQEKVIEAAFKRSAELLKEIIESGQPEKVLAKKLDQIDQVFFMVVSANVEEARRQKREDVAQALTAIGNMAMSMVQQRQMQKVKQTAEPEQPETKIEIAR